MGVLGLWQLIESAGRPVALETLEGKVLAVDASILLNQAIKGMKDKQGRTIANAHLTVLFHRVCKLLFYRIKPVFVFDGGAPELKRRTLMRRQQRRDKAASDMVKASENALMNLLKQRALEEVTKSEPAALSSAAVTLNKEKARGNLKAASSSASADMYELPPLPASMVSLVDSDSESEDDDSNDHVGRYTNVEDMDEIDTESSEFCSLPLELQHEILTEVKDTRKSKMKVNWQDLPKSSDDFSKYQMSRLIKHSKLSQKIIDLRKTMKSRSAGLVLSNTSMPVAGHVSSYNGYDVDASRIASEDHAHYILLKNVRHDRSAPSKTEAVASQPCTLAANEPQTRSRTVENIASQACSDAVEAAESLPRSAAVAMQSCSGASVGAALAATAYSNRLSTEQPEDIPSIAKFTFSQPELESVGVASCQMPGDGMRTGTYRLGDTTSTAGMNNPSHVISSGGVDGSSQVADDFASCKSFVQHAPEPVTELVNRQLPEHSHRELSVIGKGHIAGSALATIADARLCIIGSCSGIAQPAHIDLPSIGTIPVKAADHSVDQEARCASVDRNSLSISVPPTLALPSHVSTIAVDSTGDSESDDEANFIEVATIAHGNNTSAGRLAGGCDKSAVEPLVALDTKSDADESDLVISSALPPAVPVKSSDSNETNKDTETSVSKEWNLLLPDPTASSQMSPEGFTEDDVHRLELALESERTRLTKEQRKQEATALTVTEQMIQEAQELLKLFGVPFVVSPSEAEAQCATLEALGLCHGVITDDSDVWLFGGHIVYKNFFKQDKTVELYKATDIQNLFGLNRNKLIALALVSGSDYTDGLDGAGPVTAMEILSEFNGHGDGIMCLKAFAEWWQKSKSVGITAEELPRRQRLLRLTLPPGFPEDRVTDAYLKPVVDSSNEAFTWANPELHLLRNFALERFGWQQNKTDDMILPVLQRLNQRQSQLRIDAFFVGHGHAHTADGSYLQEKFKSKRVKKAASVLLGSHPVEAVQNGSSMENAAVYSTTAAEPDLQRQRRRKRAPTTSSKSRRQKKSKGHVELVPDAFSDSGDEALMMAAMDAFDGKVGLDGACSADRNDPSSGATENRVAKSDDCNDCTSPGYIDRSRSRAMLVGQPNVGPSVTLSKPRDMSGCTSRMKVKQRRGTGQRRAAGVTAGRRVQACLDLSESSSDSE